MISIVKKRNQFLSVVLAFGLIVSLFLALFTSVVSANEIQVFEGSDELIYVNTEADVFYYNDKMLLDNIGGTSASGEIALASIGLAEAAYDENRINSALAQMGYSTLFVSKYYFEDTTREDNDVVAYSIAEKYVNYGGELYRMIAVPIRGTCETCEWYSNFNIGLDETHRGFNQAAWKVLGRLSEYLYDPSYNVQHTVIWTMGHSRGAAVANIIAGEISTGNAFSDVMSRDYVFGYTFACPAVSTKADPSLPNIFNFNNGGDIVPALPLSAWGFKRYGQTIELPASDYDNLRQRYQEETGEEYQVGMTTVTWEAVLQDLAATREEFVGNDKIQLAVDIIAWDRGGKADPNYSLLDVILTHPCADAEIVGGVLKTTLFPKSTLEAMTLDLTVADFQLMLDSDLQAYLDLETDLQTAIIDTAEMSDIDSEDEETHEKYLSWCSWLYGNGGLVSRAEDMTNIVIDSKADLRIAYAAAGERYVDYKDIASTIRDVFSLLYDTEGNLLAPFTQGHPQQTYLWWVNSFYYGYKGWFNNSDISIVNWKGRYQRTYVGDSCFSACENIEIVSNFPEGIYIGYQAFGSCLGMKKVDFSGNGVIIGVNAFIGCENLTDVNFLGERITIENDAFAYCRGIKSLIIPDSINKVGDTAFRQCGIENLTIPYDADYFDNISSYSIFWDCPITNLTISKGRDGEYYDDSVIYPYIMSEPFAFLKVDEGVKSLGGHMIWTHIPYFYKIDEIELPSTLERINTGAFRFNAVEKVKFNGDIAAWCSIEFGNYSSNPLSCGTGEFWVGNEMLTMLVIPDGVNEVKAYAFNHYSGLASVTIPKSVTSIGYSAFNECYGIKDVYYAGNQEEWNKVEISSENDPLKNAQIHFLSHIHNLEKTKARKVSCLIDGNSEYWTCSICGKFFANESAESEIEKDSWIIPATGHAFGEWKTVREATETEAGLETRICENDSTHVEFRDIPKISRININNTVVTLSNYSYTYSGSEQKPTVTVKNGSITLTPGTNYSVGYADNTNAGTATVLVEGIGNYKGEKSVTFTISKANAKLVFAESAITKKPTDSTFTNTLTETTDGIVTFKSSNTNVATVNSTSGLVTIKGVGTATITASASEGKNYKAGSTAYSLIVKAPPTPTPTLKPAVSGFSDVQDPNHAYYKAIYWAADAGITKGYSDGTFGINRSCTRGEMMMFLWRYAGKPAPKNVSKSPFKDVPKTHTFYKAILWGSQKGITKGYADGTFGINRNVSRGECMMFLWRLKGKPAPKAVAKAPFPDVPKSHVFYNAVLWGYQKKITTGFTSGELKGKFGVNENCSRGQIVTFLYRAK